MPTIKCTELNSVGDFANKKHWDTFFSDRGVGKPFERHADWSLLRRLIGFPLLQFRWEMMKSPAELSILVPGCGNSRLAVDMYDDGFLNITSVDFSKVVIEYMRKMNEKKCPEMKWVEMDMTRLEFHSKNFDAIVDKGGLDILLEYENGVVSGKLYLREVQRLLKSGGKYICVTSAESHALDILFPTFRFGWTMSLHTIVQDEESSSGIPKLQTLVIVVATKINPGENYSVQYHGTQAGKLYEALGKENQIRAEYFTDTDRWYKLEEVLQFGARGNLQLYEPGRRIQLDLGEHGDSAFFHKAILFDSKKECGYFTTPYVVYTVPHLRSREWIFTSKEGQWKIVANSKAARLLMVFLDSICSDMDIRVDLYRLANRLNPIYIPYLGADVDEIRETVAEVASYLTKIVVEDVTYDSNKGRKFRCLTIVRANNVMQFEALLSTRGSSEAEQASSGEMEVDHNYLGSQYHNGIISGTQLIIQYFLLNITNDFLVTKAVVIGLGGGLLPMFMKLFQPSLKIEVVESDLVVLDVAKKHFGFKEDELLKVHITDGIKFVKELAAKAEKKVDLFVVDVASSKITSSLSRPDKKYVEKSFLLDVKELLSEQGLFVINLVTRSTLAKNRVHSLLKEVFRNTLRLKLEGDGGEVIFALRTDLSINEMQLSIARNELEKALQREEGPWTHLVNSFSKAIELLKEGCSFADPEFV